MAETQVDVTAQVVRALERAGGSYVLVGSLASIVYGRIRSTLDADILVDLRPEKAAAFVQALGPAFYSDQSSIREALESGRHFNVIHIETTFKVDVFSIGGDEYCKSQLRRGKRAIVQQAPTIEMTVTTPEDAILSKLRWYRDGGSISDRQWLDVLGVLELNRGELDETYLREWARRLDVESLLDRALSEI